MSSMHIVTNHRQSIVKIGQAAQEFLAGLKKVSASPTKANISPAALPVALNLITNDMATRPSDGRGSPSFWAAPLIFTPTQTAHLKNLQDNLNSWASFLQQPHTWHLVIEPLTEQEWQGDIQTPASYAMHLLLTSVTKAATNHFIFSQAVLHSDIPDPQEYQKAHINLTRAETKATSTVLEELTAAGYIRHRTSLDKGGFIVQGDQITIADPFSPSQYKIQFLGSTVERIIAINDRRSQDITTLTLPPIKFPAAKAKLIDHLQHFTLIQPSSDPILLTKHTITYNSLETESTFPFTASKNSGAEVQNLIVFYDNLDRVKHILESNTSKDIQLIRHDLWKYPFNLQSDTLTIISESELFPAEKKSSSPVSYERARELIGQLEVGKAAVHADHGIGLYEGLQTRTINGHEHEYIVLRYAAGDALSVPVEYAHKITPYIGASVPAVHRLGGTAWVKTKQRAKHDAIAFAKELLQIARARALKQRSPYFFDPELTKTLAQSFQFALTADQTQTWQEIEQDLSKSEPMDRLIVGDVGFGKTEIAIRAAAHAVHNGYQVAVLAPTTLLVQQHIDTFQSRLPHLKNSIATLSRFSSAAAMAKVREQITTGEANIIIGTHALLSNRTQWKKLGLIIIDEEQRFGVKQKEHLKKIRGEVDILSLSATPIPRTLSMALSGLRQLSIIATPPPGRQDIIQKVSRLHDEALTEAIERELKRSGQVYVVSPKVRQLHAIKEHIHALVPQAKVAIAHGQMDDKALSDVIHQFDAQEINVLVASSIIENGLDLPTANTMVVMNAPHFGLSDLYQLRGRIGRRATQGYAYFFYNQTELTDIQRQRLAAITEASRQGSGWLIAQRDLEMRGAGNLLGAEQHGAGDAIGVQLYLDMVHQALGEQELEPNNVDIQLPISALLPAHYIADVQERSRWYQRLSRSQNEATLQDQKDKLAKTYGDLPEEAQNLILLLQLQHAAAKNGITKITTTTITPTDEDPYHRLEIEAQNLPQLLGKLNQLGNWQVKGTKALWPTHKITKEIVRKLAAILS